MDPRKENWEYFRDRHSDIYKAYEEFGKALHEKGGPLSERDCSLVKIGVAVASQFDYALSSHIERALKAGCTLAEIEHAILLTATTAGFPRMMSALMVFRGEIEEKT